MTFSAFAPRIVHLGAGAFFRAHLAAYTQLSDQDWRITAVNLHSAQLREAMQTSGHEYLVLERGPNASMPLRVDCVDQVLCATDQFNEIIEALTAPMTHIISLTITEKGYCVDPSTRTLNLADPVIIADLNNPHHPTTTPGILVEALRLRCEKSINAVTLLSCDNLSNNGALLKDIVIGFAARLDTDLAQWIADTVSFPNTMVDRITPAPTDKTVGDANAHVAGLGRASVETEPFKQWVIEDAFNAPRPLWENVGALMVKDVTPYEHLKLRMLNGAHSMMAYAGFVKGHKYIRDVMGDETLKLRVVAHMVSAAKTLDPLLGINFEDYAAQLLTRFENPAIAHETYQIAADGTQKLPQRIFAPAMDALTNEHDITPFAYALAAWIKYCTGEGYRLNDPREDEIRKALSNEEDPVSALINLPDFFPAELLRSKAFTDAVRSQFADF